MKMTGNKSFPRVLSIAGSDSSGGAGIQADIKTITVLGGYAMTAITAVTAQNTHAVTRIETLSPAMIKEQIEAVLVDIGVDAIKIGMLGNQEIISAVCNALEPVAHKVPIIIDPVMVATSGATLLENNAIDILKKRLIPLAYILTPNLLEASLLIEENVTVEAVKASRKMQDALLKLGSAYILLKDGHGSGNMICDLLITSENPPQELIQERLKTNGTHGSGCTLSSAIATLIAQGFSAEEACKAAQLYVYKAIKHAPDFSSENGPLMHNFQEKRQ